MNHMGSLSKLQGWRDLRRRTEAEMAECNECLQHLNEILTKIESGEREELRSLSGGNREIIAIGGGQTKAGCAVTILGYVER